MAKTEVETLNGKHFKLVIEERHIPLLVMELRTRSIPYYNLEADHLSVSPERFYFREVDRASVEEALSEAAIQQTMKVLKRPKCFISAFPWRCWSSVR